jgi:hypothetical protein
MPGAGLEPACPASGTPDFKSGASHQFRHPGEPRIAPPGRIYSRGANLYDDGIFVGGLPTTIAIS